MKSGIRFLPLQADLQDVLTQFLQLSAKFPCLSYVQLKKSGD